MLPFSPITLLHALAAIFLACCAVVDARSHRIPNAAWILGAALLLPARAWIEVTEASGMWPSMIWGLGLTAAALIMWAVRVWGGADAKGVMLLAWALPPFSIGPVDGHPLLYAIPVSLLGVLAWQRIRPGAVPFYALLAPSLWLVFLVLWIIRA